MAYALRLSRIKFFDGDRWIPAELLAPHLSAPAFTQELLRAPSTFADMLRKVVTLPSPWSIDVSPVPMNALVSTKGFTCWPEPSNVLGQWSFTQLTAMSASTHRTAFIFESPRTASADKAGFMTGTVTTGDTVTVSIQTVDGSGDPTGTVVGGSQTQVINSTDDNTFFEVTLGSAASLTLATEYALVIENGAGGGNMQIRAITRHTAQFPYNDYYNGTTWAKGNTAPLMTLHWSSGDAYSPVPGVFPFTATSTTSFHVNNATADERGIKFQVPFKCKAAGAWIWTRAAAGASFDIVLYDGSNNVIASRAATDGDVNQTNSDGMVKRLFTAPVDLAINTTYRLVLKPTVATNIVLTDFSVPSAAIMDMWDGGQNVHSTRRVDAGAWTDTTTTRDVLGIIYTHLDDATGGGSGMLVHPGMSGGMRG